VLVIDSVELMMACQPSAYKLVTAACLLANFGERPVLMVLLAVNSFQTNFLRVCDVLLLHHICLEPAAACKTLVLASCVGS